MRILVCHNFYQQPGGEDRVFADEVALLRGRGHEVETWTVHNDEIAHRSRWSVARETLWNARAARQVASLVQRHRAEIVHFHNTFPLLSAAVYGAARAAGAAVVQTLHNFRWVCAGATLQRDGQICTDCVGGAFAWQAVRHRCYRGSRAASATLAAMQALHRWRGTLRRDVDRFIVLNQGARDWFVRGGIPAEKLVLKPNFVTDPPAIGDGSAGVLLFVGRLSAEKGVEVLIEAFRRPEITAPLRIAGDGPLAPQITALAAERRNVRWLGQLSGEEVAQQMRQAAAIVIPSTCFEGFPKTLVEALSVGTPIMASRIGALAELVDDGRTGALFEAGSAAALAQSVTEFQTSPGRFLSMRAAARQEYETHYTATRNYTQLLEIYRQAMAQRGLVADVCEPLATASGV